MPKSESSSALRRELEQKILGGRCAYCRRAAEPDRPLTREHVIPRAKGGGRKDARIIVPACARCNNQRGCQELALFLILRPPRISAFLDHLASLSPESIQQMDLRVFAELYAAVWMLGEGAGPGQEWRAQLRRVSFGRTLHRRRYAARRVVRDVGGRLEQRRARLENQEEWSPAAETVADGAPVSEETLDQLAARLVWLLSLVWQVPPAEVGRELARQVRLDALPRDDGEPAPHATDESVLPLDGWRRRTRSQRLRVDRRRGRSSQLRGRAA